MRTTVTHDPAVIDLQQWARRYVALVNDLLTREALDRAG
jgi:uracil DNA glycosylase